MLPSQRDGCPTRLDRTRLRSKRGAPKGRVGHKFSELNFLRKFRRAAAASRSLECVTFRIVLVLKTASSRNKIYSVSSVTLPKQCSTHTPKGEPKIFPLVPPAARRVGHWNFQSKFDCNGTCNVEYVQHYMLRYYAIRAYKFALEVSNKQSLFGVPHSSRCGRHQGNQRFSAQHYNQNYSVLGYQARSAPLVSNGRPARKAIILIILFLNKSF